MFWRKKQCHPDLVFYEHNKEMSVEESVSLLFQHVNFLEAVW